MDTEKRAYRFVLKKFSAFTLVELIVVVTILAILATVGFLALSGYSQDAKDATVKANVRSVMTAISAESAITNNSPRYYVVHEAGAALADGAVAYVDGSPVTLTGGAYGTANTNYSAGNPDWAKLKLNPEKFRLSALGSRFVTSLAGLGSDETSAAFNSKTISIGAMDAALTQVANGRMRSASYFQVVGISPATGAASVSGNFPGPNTAQTASGAVSGLVKNPSSNNLTGALTDGTTGIIIDSCRLGYYCPAESAAVQCPANYYCPANSVAPTACAAGLSSAPGSGTQSSCESVWLLNEAWYTVNPNKACGGCANNDPTAGTCTVNQNIYTSVGIRNCYNFNNGTYPGTWYTAGQTWCDASKGAVYCHAPQRQPCGGDRGESNRTCP